MYKTPSKGNENLKKQEDSIFEAFERMSMKEKEDFLEKVTKKYSIKGN